MGNVISLNNGFDAMPQKFNYDGWDKVPNGLYEAVLETWVTFPWRKPRLALIFNIIEAGEYNGRHVPAFFGIKRHKGKTRERGGFIASPRCDLMRLYYKLNPSSPKIRPDRVPLTKLNGIYRIKTELVLKDGDGKPHPEQMIYSKAIKIDS